MTTTALLQALDAHQSWAEDLYRHFHANPELSFQETETAAEITRQLESFGVDEILQIGGGVVGVLRNGEGPTVLYRADIDGLPVKEDTGFEYASTKTQEDLDGKTVPVMHACGHDMHIVAGLGAARVLAEHRDAWSGTYLALFQPAEETGAGARAMVDDGLVDKVPHPDVALSQHVLTAPAAGKVATRVGPTLSTAASIRVTIRGTGSHGSMPHLSVDPVLTAASIVTRLQGIVARELNPFDVGVVTVGSFQAGAKANVIPGEATLLLNVRAYEQPVKEKILTAITRIVNAECEASGTPQPADIEVYESYPPTVNDAEVTERVTAAFREHLGEERVEELAPVPASEDFSEIPTAFGIPYTYWGFGGFPDGDPTFPNHNPKFGPVLQPTLRTGTEAALTAAMAFLGTE